MSNTLSTVHGQRILFCAADGPALDSEQAAVDVLGDVFSVRASTVVVPVQRLGDGFLSLRTRIAGTVTQKFVNYRVRLVILGDIGEHLAASESLRAFVAESNRGDLVWFLPDERALHDRLGV